MAKSDALGAKLARRDKWLAVERTKAERIEAKLAAEKVKADALGAKVARRDEWLVAEKKKAARAEAKLAKVESVVFAESMNAEGNFHNGIAK